MTDRDCLKQAREELMKMVRTFTSTYTAPVHVLALHLVQPDVDHVNAYIQCWCSCTNVGHSWLAYIALCAHT